MSRPQIPTATYRLQFHQGFTFRDAAELIPYLARLGISHCYASPYLRARPGSTHGYDIIDHGSINPEIGTQEDFEIFLRALHEHDMGQILDIVPNHMGVMGSDNAWWLDVLENGEASQFADYFDIDWNPIKDELQGKVLVPVLDDQYGNVLDRGELKLEFDSGKAEFSITYYQHRFPVDPKEYPRILNRAIPFLQQQITSDDIGLIELQSLIAAFGHLPSRTDLTPEKRSERNRDKEVHKRRLANLLLQHSEVAGAIRNTVNDLNAGAGNPQNYDALHDLIKAQAYRLAYWRVAADDINYRRFFDVNDLAGIRTEKPEVFNATHAFVLDLVSRGHLNGFRIDHPDGLYNPAEYFRHLQSQRGAAPDPSSMTDTERIVPSLYVVAEKILLHEEKLPDNWPIFGTTGYDFLNLVNGLFIDSCSGRQMDRTYRAFAGPRDSFRDTVYKCKKLVMKRALASELNVLANLLSQIALADRHTCDFTVNSLRDALAEVIAAFTVYRTYITPTHVSSVDHRYIAPAVSLARLRNTTADTTIFDFVRDVLLLKAADGHLDSYRRAVNHFAMKFQQFTSVVMAKGVEDTALYRYHRLISLNDVGGDPSQFGISVEDFHRRMEERSRTWPHAMLSTSTHDTKRSEDVRARIDVLSEFPQLWRRHVRDWKEVNREKKRTVNGCEAPSPNDEYALYQTLIGVWPTEVPCDRCRESIVQRIVGYSLKAVREAKLKTSWSNQNEAYESAFTHFIRSILSVENTFFWDSFHPFQRKVARLGMLGSVAQTLIKLVAPGVPDFYQGTELWDLSLVDPDNRRPVDYEIRSRKLEYLQKTISAADKIDSTGDDHASNRLDVLFEHLDEGHLKLFVIWKSLALRKQNLQLFNAGSYVPLLAVGDRAEHVIAFARVWNSQSAMLVVPRLFGKLFGDAAECRNAELWGDTSIHVPKELAGIHRNVFTMKSNATARVLPIQQLLEGFPFALLINDSTD
jgi:(1->4)-alpha-D-glucan 1-alpha-D-glucosylmutase